MSGAELSPAWTLIGGAALVPLLRGTLRAVWMVALPLAGMVQLWLLPAGEFGQVQFLGEQLLLVRVDRWSVLFALGFLIAAFVCAVYALHVRDGLQPAAGLAYAGAAIGAVLAGDLLTLFVFWELTAFTSVLLVWAGGGERAWRAGMRYIVIQLVSGMLLLIGALEHLAAAGSLRFEQLGLDAPGGMLLFLAFGIKCAFPLLHNWLQDAYPEATETGTVFLSAFSTKLAVYALARGFAGTEALVWIGAVMAVFPVFYALIENDLRRVLAYSLNNQLGFMVVGVGIGTELALNGAASHAFGHILYKALLFMSMGAVLLRAGTVNGTDLGGLYRSMPWTAGFCIVGAASISALPLFSGFVSKSMILSAVAGEERPGVWLALLFASAGVLLYCGIRVPYLAFFAHDSGKRCPEAPPGMRAAMAITAALCIGIGVYPDPLYALLPFPVQYQPYTGAHVLTQLQLLAFSALAFAVLLRAGLYPPAVRRVNLDSDWIYRIAAAKLYRSAAEVLGAALAAAGTAARLASRSVDARARLLHGPGGVFARVWPTGAMGAGVMAMLLALLLSYYAL